MYDFFPIIVVGEDPCVACALSYAKNMGFVFDLSLLPDSVIAFPRFFSDSFYIDVLSNFERPFLSPDFLPEFALCYTSEELYFTRLDFANFHYLSPQSDELSNLDIVQMAYFLYNITFVHLLFLGFIFTTVIVAVVSLLLNRNLRVRRQKVFEQNSVSVFRSLEFYR